MSFDARAIIAQVRGGDTPSGAALSWFANGLADGQISDAQAGAFAMAVCLNGLGTDGRVNLTCAMRDSGDCLQWDFDGPVLDKHSTGGVGDCVSLVLAPLLAAAGVYVPMISGRGLGHTGGTLDKLEAIPGLNVDLDTDRLRSVVGQVGCAIASASARIAPADKRLYAIRDVTATVESLDLITASILSKKLAAGLQGLILDVKCGSGAFMKSPKAAKELATCLVETAKSAGCKTAALVTDMDQPLAPALGNALEIAEVMQVLCNNRTGRLRDLSLRLAAELLVLEGISSSLAQAMEKLETLLSSGQGAEKFAQMVAMMGGPLKFAENWQRFLPEASVIHEVLAPKDGVITAWDCEALGLAVVALGGGRQVESDPIDPAVGLSDVCALGSKVTKGTVIARVHASRVKTAEAASATVLKALRIGKSAAKQQDLVLDRFD